MYNQNYGLFFRFIEKYSPVGFQNINRTDPFIIELEGMMKNNNQFFFICDLLHIKILFTSNLSAKIIGVNREEVTLYHFLERTHPEQLEQHNLQKAKMFRPGNDLFIEGGGSMLLSTSFKLRNHEDIYRNCMMQCYIFFREIPYKTAYMLMVTTDIERVSKSGNGFHYYVGSDLNKFRFPDEKLLMTGRIFSSRELQIISMVAKGISSDQISKIIHISKHTVNTHRRNILIKTKKESINKVVFDLKEQGLL